MTAQSKQLDTVSLLCDLPDLGLKAGEVGVIVEEFPGGAYEVEFHDENGRTPDVRTLRAGQFITLFKGTDASRSQQETSNAMSTESEQPELAPLRGVVAAEILEAVKVASRALREAGIPHALAGGLAVGVHGYPRTTDDVDFLVGDEAFVKHLGGLVTLKVPLISIGKVRVDFVSVDEAKEGAQLRPAMALPGSDDPVPVVPITALVYMKLKANRQKDVADLVELLKRGKINSTEIERYLAEKASHLASRWQNVKQIAAQEE